MSLTSSEYKERGNEYYRKNQSDLAIQSYSEAIKLVIEKREEEEDCSIPLYILYSNRSAAFIQEKNYYSGYEDAKQSLKLKKEENFKSFYRGAICAYHLGFLEKCEDLIKEATNNYHQNLLDYHDLKILIKKKVDCMKRWRKPISTAKKSLKLLEQILENTLLMGEVTSILYHIRYLLRCYFEKKKEKKLMNINPGDLGLQLHQLAVQFNSMINIQKLIESNCLFEDLILNEMPDVGSLRLQHNKQRHLSYDQQNEHLEDQANEDLTAYEFSFFVNNILASLVVNCTNEKIISRSLKQIHRLTTIDLYREALGDTLSDALKNYIYSQWKNSFLLEKLLSNQAIQIFFYDFVQSSSQRSVAKIIKNITADQWKKQSITTIELVLKLISQFIRDQGRELIEPNKPSEFEIQFQKMFKINLQEQEDQEKEYFYLMINVLTKIFMVFGIQPFNDRAKIDPLFLYVQQLWFDKFNITQHRYDIPFLLNGWTSIITQWLQLNQQTRIQYIQQTGEEQYYTEH